MHLLSAPDFALVSIRVKALYFGPSGRRLFGIFHPAASRLRGREPILLCYPGIHEYNAAHWAFRRLAAQLQRLGHPVFRFDYYGTGDSEGPTSAHQPEEALQNVRTAYEEMLDLADERKGSLIGLRLGAHLALSACQSGLSAKSLVLWEPLSNGSDYLEELSTWDRFRQILLLHYTRRKELSEQLLGYPMSPKAREAWSKIQVSAERPRAQDLLLLGQADSSALTALYTSLEKANESKYSLTLSRLEGEGQRGGKALLSNESIKAILAHFEARSST